MSNLINSAFLFRSCSCWSNR